jgi:hypothetical protein
MSGKKTKFVFGEVEPKTVTQKGLADEINDSTEVQETGAAATLRFCKWEERSVHSVSYLVTAPRYFVLSLQTVQSGIMP